MKMEHENQPPETKYYRQTTVQPLVVKCVARKVMGGHLPSRERENISRQTGKPENHRLKSAFGEGI